MVRRKLVTVFVGLFLVAGCAGAGSSGSGVATARSSSPEPAPRLATCVPDGLEQLTLGKGRRRIAAVRLGDGNIGVVLSNMRGSNVCDWMSFARELADHGYQVLLYRYRNDRAVDRSTQDLRLAVRRMREQGAQEVFLVGASWGGTISVRGAGTIEPEVAGVVSVSGGGGYTAKPARLTVPAMFVAALNDDPAPMFARRMYEKATGAPARELVLVDGGAHGTRMLDPGFGKHSRKLRDRILRFVGEHTGIPE